MYPGGDRFRKELWNISWFICEFVNNSDQRTTQNTHKEDVARQQIIYFPWWLSFLVAHRSIAFESGEVEHNGRHDVQKCRED